WSRRKVVFAKCLPRRVVAGDGPRERSGVIVVRYKWIMIACAGVLALGLGVGAQYLHGQRTRRLVEDALEVLLLGDDLTSFDAALADLEGTRGLEHELDLLRGARYLDAGENEKALALIGRVPAEGRLRVPRLILAGRILYRQGRRTDAEHAF